MTRVKKQAPQASRNRIWLDLEVEVYYQRIANDFSELSFEDLEQEAFRCVAEQERYLDEECLQLNAASSLPNPKVAKMLASSLGNRPSLGHPGQKYNKGMEASERLEVMLSELLKRLFRVRYVETRVPSGTIANLYSYMATTKPGDRIMAFSDRFAGHVTHHSAGAAGLYGLEVHEVPCDPERMDVDVAALRSKAQQLKPKLIIVAGSMCLFPYSVAEVRKVADEIGAWVLYDAAHMGGMIAGGAFQQPLEEGAHLMTGSTYKSFGGPPSGIVLTNEPTLAERLDRIAFPGMTANFDLSRTAAMIIATLDLLEYGETYAQQCIANAQALAEALQAEGLPVFRVPEKGFTNSQHVAIEAHSFGGGDAASIQLQLANVITCGIGLPRDPVEGDVNGIRLGTPEITRRGMTSKHMPAMASFFRRVLLDQEVKDSVRADVLAFRQQFSGMHFVRN
ncbi:MAG TPA: aminotransferase class I/II-fold pyridoxal phosphate-dependent enzyme [Deltaproteobacteria bacterium]|nr:aminotransferase class I/II-fold pyridoxal phosphate-dependent enzyme [Deltaproteobacteria bacterium]